MNGWFHILECVGFSINTWPPYDMTTRIKKPTSFIILVYATRALINAFICEGDLDAKSVTLDHTEHTGARVTSVG